MGNWVKLTILVMMSYGHGGDRFCVSTMMTSGELGKFDDFSDDEL